MKYPIRKLAVVATILVGSISPVLAQSDRTLELDTDDGQIDVPLDNSVPLRILGNGDISAKASDGFSCPTGGPSCEDVRVSLETIDNGLYTVTPNPVAKGNQISINWKATGAWECEGTGLPGTSWSSTNPKDPAGQQSVGTNALDEGQSYPVQLTCSNGPVTDTQIVNLQVEESTIITPEGCDDVPQLQNFADWTLASSILYDEPGHDPALFSDIFNAPFPGTPNTAHINIRKGHYAAIQFTTPSDLNSTHSGQFNGENASQQYPGGDQRLVSISRCPGVFDTDDLEDTDCIASRGTTEAFYWRGPGHPQAGFRCELQAGTTYYLNMAYTQSEIDDLPPVPANCEPGTTHCGSLIFHVTNYSN